MLERVGVLRMPEAVTVEVIILQRVLEESLVTEGWRSEQAMAVDDS